MLTEIAIIMLSVYIVAHLRVRLSRKIAVVACFAPRALVISASLIRLIWLCLVTPNAVTYKLWRPALISQIHVCLSISSACVPYMVPFFKGLHNDQTSMLSPKLRAFRMKKGHNQPKASIWSRRQRKGKVINSWDSLEVASLHYDRVPQFSPRIPSPKPLSPLTPPRLLSSRERHFGSESLSLLRVNGVLSPLPGTPQTLLTQTFTPTRKAPSPPSRSVASVYSNHAPSSAASTPRTHRFSLFPPQRSSSRSPQPHPGTPSPTAIPPIRSLRPQTHIDSIHSPLRNISNAQAPKFSTTPALSHNSPPTNVVSTNVNRNKLQKRGSVKTPVSPMGAALDKYFKSVVPDNPPPPPLPPTTSSPRVRNQPVLTPLNSTPRDVLRDDLYLPRDSIDMAKGPQRREPPDYAQ